MKIPDEPVCPKCGKLKLKRDGTWHKCVPKPKVPRLVLVTERGQLKIHCDHPIEVTLINYDDATDVTPPAGERCAAIRRPAYDGPIPPELAKVVEKLTQMLGG